MTMTPAEKANETRKRHAEQRKAKEQEAKQMKEVMTSALFAILRDSKASIDQRLQASEMLLEIKGW